MMFCNTIAAIVAGATMLCAVAAAAMSQSREAAPLRGVVKSVRQAAFATELMAPAAVVHKREGETFIAGEILVSFDCERQQQELAALSAVEREARVAVETNQYLSRRGASNRNDLDVAVARHDKARSEAAAVAQRLKSCVVVAPFAGVVVELGINAHEFPTPNKPFMLVAAHRELEIEIIVPSRFLGAVTPTHEFSFTIDETRRHYAARIKRAAGVVDAVSQTVKLYAEIVGADDAVLPGMSGTAVFAAVVQR